MFRGTTPQISLDFKINLEELNILAFYITFSQGFQEVLEKSLEEITISKNIASVNLTQKDTLNLLANQKVSIQARLKIDDKAYVTNVVEDEVYGILKDGEI